MIDFIIIALFIWSFLYFYTKEMYKDIIIPKSWSNRKRNFFAEIAGILCFITAPIGFLYAINEFIYLTLIIIWDNIKLLLEAKREIKKLRSIK